MQHRILTALDLFVEGRLNVEGSQTLCALPLQGLLIVVVLTGFALTNGGLPDDVGSVFLELPNGLEFLLCLFLGLGFLIHLFQII